MRNIVTALLLAATTALAAPVTNVEPVSADFVLPASDVLQEQFVSLGQTARIEGTTADDAFVFGIEQMLFSGKAGGQVWIGGRQTDFSGTASNHVHMLGLEKAIFRGQADRGLAIAGQTVQIATNATVGGALYLAAQEAHIGGRIGGRAVVYAVRATLEGEFGGNVTVRADEINLLPGTRIAGDLTYRCGKELFLNTNVVHLSGRLVREPMPETKPDPFSGVMTQAIYFLNAFFTGMLLMLLFPRFTGHTVRVLRVAPWRCGFSGAVSMLVLPLASILFMVTGLGILIAMVVGASFGLLVYLGTVVSGISLGTLILRQRGPQTMRGAFAALFTGTALLYAAKAMPVLGGFISTAASMFGAGALLVHMFASQKAAQTPAPTPETGADMGSM